MLSRDEPEGIAIVEMELTETDLLLGAHVRNDVGKRSNVKKGGHFAVALVSEAVDHVTYL